MARAADAQDATPTKVGGGSRFVVDVRDSTDIHIGDVYVAPGEVSWPVRVGVPPPLAAAFQPRADLRGKVDEALAGAQVAVITQVLQGDGGTGKTQLAAATFRDAAARGDLDVAVWVTAASRDAVASAYARTAGALNLAPSADLEEMAQTFLAWLTGTSRTWLIVLDDVADPADLRGMWPSGPTGQVLVTTRRRDVTRTLGSSTPIDVGSYTPQEALDYLVERLTGGADSHGSGVLHEAAQLADDLGYLPVALAQAAAVIVDDASTCAHLRRQLRNVALQLSDVFPEGSADQYGLTLAAVWRIALSRADALQPVGLATPVALLAAVLDPAGFPDAVVTTEAVRLYLADPEGFRSLALQLWSEAEAAGSEPSEQTAEAPAADEDDAEDVSVEPVDEDVARRALRNLHRLNVVTHDARSPSRAVRVHALAQRAIREQTGEAATTVAYEVAAYALSQSWPDVHSDGAMEQALRANAAVLAENHPELVTDPHVNQVFFAVAHSLVDTGLYSQSEAYCQQLVESLERSLGADHSDTLAARANLAFARMRGGHPAEAASAYVQLLPHLERALGAEDRETLAARGNLAIARLQAGYPEEAAATYAELLGILERVVGAEHSDTLICRSNLALARLHTGHPAEAAAAYVDLLPVLERVLGTEHPDTLLGRSNLALARLRAGHPAEAAATYADVIPVLERVLGAEHPNTLLSRSLQATARLRAGHPAEALTSYVDLLPVLERVLGDEHPETLTARSLLAVARLHAGHVAEAESAYNDLLPVMERVLGPEHPETLTAHNYLASARLQSGHPAEAASAWTELLPRMERALGVEHPDTLAARSLLAGAWLNAGRQAEAAAAYAELIPALERVLGAEHPDTFAARNNLALAELGAGAAPQAAAAYVDLLSALERKFGSEHPDTLTARSNLALARLQAGHAAEAAEAYRDLLPVLERVLGAEHPRTVTARSLHATAVLRAGDSARAVAAFAELLPVMERVLGAHHPDTQASWANFAGGQLEIADVSGAARSYSRVLGEELQRLGPGHPRTIARRFQLALAVAASGDIPSAMDALPDMATWPVTVNQYFEAVWRHRESVRFHREHGQPQAERAHLERLALLHDRFGATSDDVDADLARLEALTEQRRDTERNHG